MRYTITAIGSRGDVQPYLALGAGLARAGHAVRMATHDEFRTLAEGQGLDFFPLSGSPRAMLETEAGRAMLRARTNPLRFIAQFTRLTLPYLEGFLDESLRACTGADALIFSGTSLFTGYPVAEKLGLPVCSGVLQPLTPTTAVENAFFPACPRWWPFSGMYHQLTHLACMAMVGAFFSGGVKPVRARLDLPPITLLEAYRRAQTSPGPMLYGFSPSVIPQPADWPVDCRVTGYWFLEEEPGWTPPAELTSFLEAGPPPVYIGFGSLPSEDPVASARLAVEALALAGQRGILFRGWNGLQPEALPETILAIDPTPHGWLFPRLAAVAHHGGAGTTAATFRAGVPGIVLPFFADQPFWAHRVQALGVGPTPIPRWRLTSARLAAAIRQAVEDQEMRARAAALGERIRAEDGVGTAVRMIEEHVQMGQPRSAASVTPRW
jgi:sterol 3beta-glucosyltransferase